MIMTGFLKQIRPRKEAEVRERKVLLPLSELRDRIEGAPAPLDFRKSLARPGVSLIAEVKRSSPSAGRLTPVFQPRHLARSYQEGGAAAVSVLTDDLYFGGKLADLKVVKKEVSLPVLRKDFILDDYQVYEARAAGADALLLIAEFLSPRRLHRLLRLTHFLGMSALVEAHSRAALEVSIASGAAVLGINSRNLKTLEVDLSTALDLLALIPPDRIKVSESGIRSAADVAAAARAGADAVLIGEALMKSNDKAGTIRELLEDGGRVTGDGGQSPKELSFATFNRESL